MPGMGHVAARGLHRRRGFLASTRSAPHAPPLIYIQHSAQPSNLAANEEHMAAIRTLVCQLRAQPSNLTANPRADRHIDPIAPSRRSSACGLGAPHTQATGGTVHLAGSLHPRPRPQHPHTPPPPAPTPATTQRRGRGVRRRHPPPLPAPASTPSLRPAASPPPTWTGLRFAPTRSARRCELGHKPPETRCCCSCSRGCCCCGSRNGSCWSCCSSCRRG